MVAQKLARIGNYLGLARDGWKLSHARSEEAQRRARRHLIERMGRLRSLPQKLGQILAFSHGDRESSEDFSRLHESAQPLPFEEVRPILEVEWGQRLHRVVREISPDASAASLGQVHRALLRDGREVAIKVQYPGIHEALQLDLKLLGWLSLPVGNLQRGFDLAAYRQAILEDLERELDYRQEAEFQRAFFDWGEGNSFLTIPGVVDELCTPRVLVTHWEEGDCWSDVQNLWSAEEKRRLAQGLVKFFHEGLFQRGLMHADWHPGNFRFRRIAGDVRLLLYDFGCVYRPGDECRLTLLRLIRATIHRDEPPYPLFLKLGFRDDCLQALRAKLPAVCQVLFEPYARETVYNLRDWRLGERIGDILGNDRWNFRVAGPPELVFLLRAFHGLKYYLEGLEAPCDWNRVITPHLEMFADELKQLELPRIDEVSESFDRLARHLKIRVTQNGLTKVHLTYPAAVIDDLDSLIDEDLAAQIRKKGVSLADVVVEVRRRSYAPGEVFRHAEGAGEVAVWLE